MILLRCVMLFSNTVVQHKITSYKQRQSKITSYKHRERERELYHASDRQERRH